MATTDIPIDFVPVSAQDLARCLADPMWRVCSGQLYKIMVKSDEGEGTVIPFRPNRAQKRLIARLWHRNIILKARQLGFTTLIAILFLDHALFNPDQRCGIIAQDRDAAEAIFRDKVKLAYLNLPPEIRAARPLARDSASELLFNNNSAIRVATSMRSGTIHRLHVSEFGKICAKFPDKAQEVVTGSLPAVPLDGIAIIESTAEGQEGEFFKMTERAQANAEMHRELTPRDWRFHFFPWWQEPGYKLDSTSVVITEKDHDYFAEVEATMGCEITQEQRNWYVATRDADFSDDEEKMWQEYPSTPKEAFQVSTEGTYYAKQLTAARKQGRIGRVPHVDGVPVNTFWDIGASDGTAIWLHQRIGMEDCFIGFIEGWGEGYSYYISELQKLGYVWGTHHLPHDADHHRQQTEKTKSPREELEAMRLGGAWEVLARVDDINHGIQATRKGFSTSRFDEEKCKAGIAHLAAYRKQWNTSAGCWGTHPRKDEHTEAADAYRQFGQGYTAPRSKQAKKPTSATSWRTI